MVVTDFVGVGFLITPVDFVSVAENTFTLLVIASGSWVLNTICLTGVGEILVNGFVYLTPDALDLPVLKELAGNGLVENEVTCFPVDADIVLDLYENEPVLTVLPLETAEEAFLPVAKETITLCSLSAL